MNESDPYQWKRNKPLFTAEQPNVPGTAVENSRTELLHHAF